MFFGVQKKLKYNFMNRRDYVAVKTKSLTYAYAKDHPSAVCLKDAIYSPSDLRRCTISGFTKKLATEPYEKFLRRPKLRVLF